MNPGGYLRGTVDLGGPPEIRDRAHTFPRSVFIALLLLGLLQVGCTLGLFFYVKTQVEPNLMNKKELQCWRTILKKGEAPLSMDTIAKKEGNECENVQLAFNEAVEKAVQGLKSQKQLHVGNDISQDPVLSRSNNHQTWPAAHLTIANSTSGDNNAPVHLMYWNHKEGWANTQNMNYNNGTLKVQQDGYYFVYANLCFRHHKVAKKITQDSLQLMLYVLKSNKSGRPAETLLKGGRTATWSNDSLYHFYSVYQGGIFRLLAGEEIFIKASSAELLDPSQEGSYFGAFKVLDIHL